LARCGGFEDFPSLRDHIAEVAETVRQHYKDLIAEPAEEARQELGAVDGSQGELGDPGHKSGKT